MKVLMISGDDNVFDPATPAGKRIVEYRQVLGELEILLANNNVFSFFIAFWRGLRLLHSRKFDVITAQSSDHWLWAYLLARIFDIPWQAQVHTDILNPYFRKESFKNRVRFWLARFLLPRADSIRVVSQRIKDSLTNNLQLTTNNIIVLPIFVDIERIKSMPITVDLHERYGWGKFIILMASRLAREKNIGLAIEAIHDLIKKCEKDVNMLKPLLLIVGSGSEKSNLQRVTNNLQLSQYVMFEPAVDFEKLISYYKTCDLFLLTSNYEGYGMTLIEAAVAGAKIVSSDVGIASEILKEENIFKVGDASGLLEKMKMATRDEIRSTNNLSSQTKEEYLMLYKKSFNIK